VAGYAGTGVALSQHLGRLAGEWLAGGPRPPFTDGHNHSWRPVPVVGRVPALLSVAGLWYQAEDRWR
jgi:glycine/D-amino acid oxidase-like deaminating enzyme